MINISKVEPVITHIFCGEPMALKQNYRRNSQQLLLRQATNVTYWFLHNLRKMSSIQDQSQIMWNHISKLSSTTVYLTSSKCPEFSKNEQRQTYRRVVGVDQSISSLLAWIGIIDLGSSYTFSSVTFQSWIFVLGGSFDHDTYIPFTW